MDNIVLYCKSFHRDVNRAVTLIDSIEKYNTDNIPVYISVPADDINLFKSKNLNSVTLIPDEEIYEGNEPGWIQQQIVKSNFWKLGLCENYVCLDSDGYFIKPFRVSDFIYDEQTPYTVIHEQKELFTWTVNKTQTLGFDPKHSYISDRQKIMDVFGREGKYYDFGPVPVIWSAKVWKDLENHYMEPNGLNWTKMMEYSPSEFSWYGESLLAFKSVPIYPSEPIFKVFHFAHQITDYKQQGYTEEQIAQNYLGIIMQSNFNAQLKYE